METNKTILQFTVNIRGSILSHMKYEKNTEEIEEKIENRKVAKYEIRFT
jgi:hypothetical protein